MKNTTFTESLVELVVDEYPGKPYLNLFPKQAELEYTVLYRIYLLCSIYFLGYIYYVGYLFFRQTERRIGQPFFFLHCCSAQTRTGIGLLGKPPAVKQFPPSKATRCTRLLRDPAQRRYEANKCG